MIEYKYKINPSIYLKSQLYFEIFILLSTLYILDRLNRQKSNDMSEKINTKKDFITFLSAFYLLIIISIV